MLSNGFLFALVWDPVENSYINPNEYKATRIDFNKERGKVRIYFRQKLSNTSNISSNSLVVRFTKKIYH